MITSNRKFGVEIEFVAPNSSSFHHIRDHITVIEDGSLRPLLNAGEYVSEPLQGKGGEREIHQVCEILKKYGASGDNPKTSVHVHLDGRAEQGTLRSATSLPPNVHPSMMLAVSNKLKKELTTNNIFHIINHKPINLFPLDFIENYLEDVRYLSKARLTSRPRLNYTYYWLEKPDRFEWLRNVLYFYTKYSTTMEGIVSDSRKFGNMYCLPLGKSYDLGEIAKASNMDELKQVWYKHRPPTNHYDDSRYHNVNLHSFWDRHGTVEIRSHGGTIDPYKILLWVKLHQKIVDKLEDITIEEMVAMGSEPKDFISFIEEPLLQDYIKRLLGYYSGVKI